MRISGPASPSDGAAEAPSLSRTLGREWSFLLAVLAGTGLRLDQIGIQIPLDDEWHALHAVARFGYAHVATHFGWTDYCIPLTLFDKAVADTVGLSELWLRLPVLAAGIAALVLMPLVVRPWVGREVSILFAWLLAVSPLHVYFSRYARPYSIALLLTFLAVFALPRAALSGRRGWMWIYALAAILSPYFHLTTLPVVLLPMAIAWIVRWRLRDGEASPSSGRALWIATIVVGGGLAVLLGPPLLFDHRALAYKAGRGEFHVRILADAASLLAGSARTVVVVIMGLAVVGGAIALGRRQPRLLASLGAAAVLALGIPAATHPVLIELPIVYVRYALIVLPLALLLAACGIAWLVDRAGGGALAVSVLGPALAAALAALGPVPQIHARPNAWTNHPAFQYSYAKPPCDPAAAVPPFYARLAQEPPGSEQLVEAPVLFAASGNRFHCYQRLHRQDMRIGFLAGVFDGAAPTGLPRPGELPILTQPHRYRFRSFVHLGREADLQARATLVILHKAIEKEMAGAAGTSGMGIDPWIARYRERYGAPLYDDEWMSVFRISP